MKITHLALAVAAGSLGLAVSQQASAEFIKDSKVTLGLRNFYYNNDNHDGGQDEKDWAQAFRLDLRSGYTEGMVGFGIDVTGNLAVKLDGGQGNHPNGSTFMPSESDGAGVNSWSTAGASAKAKLSKTELYIGNNLRPMLPVIITSDTRVMTQMYQGGMLISKDLDGLTLNAGQIEHTVGRASSNWTPLSVAGGTQGSNQFRFGGGDWQVNKQLTLQYYYANLKDYYKQHFAGLVHVFPIGTDQSFKTDLRYFKSSDDGKNGQPGYVFNNNGGYADHPGKVDNTTWTAMFTYSLGAHSLMLGYQSVSNDGGFVWLNQSGVTKDALGGGSEGQGGANFYLFTDAMVNQFARAGENSKLGQYSYDFRGIGVPGLKASVAYIHGDDIKATNGHGPDKDEWERDERVDYTVQNGPAKDLTLTLRHGTYRSYTGAANPNTDQWRVIFNYPLSIL